MDAVAVQLCRLHSVAGALLDSYKMQLSLSPMLYLTPGQLGSSQKAPEPCHRICQRWSPPPMASISLGSKQPGSAMPAKAAGSTAVAKADSSTNGLPHFSGVWRKDKSRSDNMDEAIRLMHLNGVVRQAIKLVKGVKIDVTDHHFSIAVFSFIPWFKVTEKYSLAGDPSYYKRRDLRRGKHCGSLRQSGSSSELHLDLEWGEPFGGVGSDIFSLSSPNELLVESTIQVHGAAVRYKTVYTRKHH